MFKSYSWLNAERAQQNSEYPQWPTMKMQANITELLHIKLKERTSMNITKLPIKKRKNQQTDQQNPPEDLMQETKQGKKIKLKAVSFNAAKFFEA